jgi:hypothetical protein
VDDKELTEILLENRRLRKALETIAKWDLPRLAVKGVPCSYESARGSNGARDYVIHLAKQALDNTE